MNRELEIVLLADVGRDDMLIECDATRSSAGALCLGLGIIVVRRGYAADHQASDPIFVDVMHA